jgi:hypothetical protein
VVTATRAVLVFLYGTHHFSASGYITVSWHHSITESWSITLSLNHGASLYY